MAKELGLFARPISANYTVDSIVSAVAFSFLSLSLSLPPFLTVSHIWKSVHTLADLYMYTQDAHRQQWNLILPISNEVESAQAVI